METPAISVEPVLSAPVSVVEEVKLKEEASTTTIKEFIKNKAIEKDVSVELALYVANGENGFTVNREEPGDMKIICPRGVNAGKPVRAKGIWQITDCYHPEITDEQAFDVEWSTNWAMKNLKNKETCTKEWTVCRWYYDN